MGTESRSAAITYYAPVTPGSLLVERYTYIGKRGGKGVQWLAYRITADGARALVKVCKTKHEALVALDA